ncbi:TIGR04282 family arsenosugar biosynthesis glycosyltransferase [Streptomyces tibetensis]|uniref:TIGR04282 family arsenosugar biosynthesis glycosyltransferase n=1 Tax=Streptomyces tibetensis TaxID=2382123 RepID=UPI0033F3CAC9
MTTLLVIAKEPRPGRVKTRLTPPFTPRQAAALAEAALADTLQAVAAAPATRRVLVLDGAPGPWLPPGFDVVAQCAGRLDERLAEAFARCTGPALLIGMDTPQVTPELLTVDFAGCDAWFGPAEDGGFWALGLACPDPALLRGVPMSTPVTGAVQRGRLVAAGLRVRDLPPLRDVDTAPDAHAVAAMAPRGRFAARLARCTPAGPPDTVPSAGPPDTAPSAGQSDTTPSASTAGPR